MPGPATSLNIGLLNRLRAAGGAFVAIDDLAREADATGESPSDRARIAADLDALAAFGFGIGRDPTRGAAYAGPAGRLCPDQIEHGLATAIVGRRIAVWSRVSSTNDLAALACGSPSNDGLVILADEQTAGRGRLGRSWTAPPCSSILMSVLLFPPRSLNHSGPDSGPATAWLTAIGAVVTAEVVSAWIGRDALVKWPNDVRVDGRKIAGILVERPAPDRTGSSSPGDRAAVIGIGLNVNLDRHVFPPDLRDRATSLQIERDGRPADRSEVARDLIRRLDHWYSSARTHGDSAIGSAWRDRSEHLGRIIRVLTPAGPHSGRLLDLDLKRGLALVSEPPPTDEIPRNSSICVPATDILSIENIIDPINS